MTTMEGRRKNSTDHKHGAWSRSGEISNAGGRYFHFLGFQDHPSLLADDFIDMRQRYLSHSDYRIEDTTTRVWSSIIIISFT